MMVRQSGNADPNFDADNVDPEALRRTVIRTGAVWAVVGSVAALVASSGRKFDQASAPGYAEAAAKKAASKKASLDAYNARVAELKASRDSGTAPPRPWEK